MFDLDYIGIDDMEAMYALTVQLMQNATRNDILYYAPTLKNELHSYNAQKLRLEGFVKAATEFERNYRIVTQLDDISNFGGIVCSTDYYALRVLKHLGYPNNVKIAGFDNVSLLKDLRFQVLSVEYSTDRIAEECINYILGNRFVSKIEYRTVWNID